MTTEPVAVIGDRCTDAFILGHQCVYIVDADDSVVHRLYDQHGRLGPGFAELGLVEDVAHFG